jgi:hypothetical protein
MPTNINLILATPITKGFLLEMYHYLHILKALGNDNYIKGPLFRMTFLPR